MTWRFRRRLRIAPGLYVNVGKHGISSVSAGVRGAHMTAGRTGLRGTVGVPGSGVSYTAPLNVVRLPRRYKAPPVPRPVFKPNWPVIWGVVGGILMATALLRP